jgi:Mitochondrial carrier protein
MFEVSTLGQPFEVLKTQLAANRGQSMAAALSSIYARGGVLGFFQGLIPWAWIEASTKGAVLLFTASEFEYRAKEHGASPFLVSVDFGLGFNLPLSHRRNNANVCSLRLGWYRWWYGWRYCSSLYYHGFLYLYEDGRSHSPQGWSRSVNMEGRWRYFQEGGYSWYQQG